MPEGPEVRVMADQISKIVGKKILAGWASGKANGRNQEPKLLHPWKGLRLEKVTELTTCGKKIFIWLRTQCLVVSLGMEGRLLFTAPDDYPRNTHYVLGFSSYDLVYANDRFPIGGIELCTLQQGEKIIEELGWDVLSTPPPFEWFQELLKKRKRRNICPFLLDQKDLCGIGNYLVSEILYVAKIHPDSRLQDLTLKQQKDLYKYCFALPQKVYRQGGTTIRSYVDTKGKKGGYQPLIYGRKTDPQGRPVTSTRSKAGRTVYYISDPSYY